mmetsp:Transcript_26540/g.38051  ORF Transcript_26540/g.38051 Transcript_26540/m.38051 type:complete len:98 (+) Transcript_26540:783-1076(+)
MSEELKNLSVLVEMTMKEREQYKTDEQPMHKKQRTLSVPQDALVVLPKDVQKMVVDKVLSAVAKTGKVNPQPTMPSHSAEYLIEDLRPPSPIFSSTI